MRHIEAAGLKRLIGEGGELAILDAREEGEFGASHPFWAVPCPLSRAELRARAILPRPDVRVCVTDGGEGYAERLAAYLEGAGYSDVSVLRGGAPAWGAAGYVLFSGVNVPSKAFGEWVEHHYDTPSVGPEELHAMRARGERMVVLDSRPLDEFRAMSIPGAVNVPGGELAYRFGDLVADADTTVVVNCAGRTRSILGAESLRRAGVANPVVALRNGTMGWELAGFSPARGETTRYAEGTPAGAAAARTGAARFAAEAGVRTLDAAGLARLREDASRTLYVLDVRDPAEFAAGHLAGTRNAPGGQLVQATDGWVAVRGSRIVLLDGAAFGGEDGVRARMAGAWLRLMGAGYEVSVLDGPADGPMATGMPAPGCPEAAAVAVATLPAAAAAALLGTPGVAVVELSRSTAFRAGHVPGALWGVRTRLERLRAPLAGAWEVVVVAPEEAVARLAVPELRALLGAAVQVRVLAGGGAAWRSAGLPVEADRHVPEDADCVDAYLRPYDRNSGIEAAMHAYLSWEVDLVHEVARDGDARFGTG